MKPNKPERTYAWWRWNLSLVAKVIIEVGANFDASKDQFAILLYTLFDLTDLPPRFSLFPFRIFPFKDDVPI
jgi:hypothetical protein